MFRGFYQPSEPRRTGLARTPKEETLQASQLDKTPMFGIAAEGDWVQRRWQAVLRANLFESDHIRHAPGFEHVTDLGIGIRDVLRRFFRVDRRPRPE